ncbi:MAG: sugar ABC transporter ATP-binding protein, partial [Anaerolineae bacterium]
MKRSDNGAAMAPLLEVKGITKRFPGVLALDKVDLQVGVGEVHGLVGKNGAGKSTLMKILMGLESPDAGQMALNGEPLTDMNPYRAKMLGIAYVPQEAQLVGPLTVGENIFCGELPIGRLGFVRWEEVHRQAAGMLDRLGQRIETHLKVEDLSVGQRQVVSIAKALFAGACLIILDEPTAPLTRREVETLFDLVRSLKGEGVSFIYISHYLGEVFEVCDDVTVLRNGRHMATRPVSSLTEPELARLMVGGEVEQAERSSVTIGEPVLTVRGFSKAGRFEDVSLEVHEGEITGLTGLAGCGKSELALAIFGLDPPDSGEIYLNGRRLEISTPAEAFREGIAYLPEDRHKHGLVPGRSVAQNITLAILRQICDRLGFIDGREERAVARRFQDALEIMTPTL